MEHEGSEGTCRVYCGQGTEAEEVHAKVSTGLASEESELADLGDTEEEREGHPVKAEEEEAYWTINPSPECQAQPEPLKVPKAKTAGSKAEASCTSPAESRRRC